jgi:hypothetical protein
MNAYDVIHLVTKKVTLFAQGSISSKKKGSIVLFEFM